MSFLDIAKKRYTVRSYTSQKVEQDKLDQILEAAHVAPTGANCQPQHLIVVQSEEGLAKIGKGANIYGAPLAIIVCSNHDEAWKRPFDGKKLTDIDASDLDLPDNLEPVNILVIGYADTSSEPVLSADRHKETSYRKPLSKTVSYEHL